MFSGRLSDKGMNQVSDSNAIQLQIALRTLEERCLKLTKRADSLQDENERLLTSRSELLAEVERLQEQQIRLREKNLRLNREYHSKQQECSLLAEKLTSFARGRVGNFKLGSDIVAGLTELREDNEGSADSLETVELQGASVSKQGNFDHAKRTLSEPNLSVIQCELDKVRKGLWSRTTVESDSYVADNSASKAENVFKPEIQSLDVGIQRTDQLRNTDYIFADPSDPPIFIEACTDNANILYGKLQNQNEILRRLMQSLKINQVLGEPGITSVVTQTSFALDPVNSSVWKNMQSDRVCPLCENVFSTLISQEEFEDHVMEHFNGDTASIHDFGN